ncbi:MAG: hypothetical protein A3F16_02115 [Deltaproteobacteria bacterium RIFCSPHIGHO2_12_FULL_43_9]|nr:MAG: hypothetical protein A3F16_02115 [Deltaproteobacteria bacterium RIFCSPHIGHO2_12_FULL_43_9]
MTSKTLLKVVTNQYPDLKDFPKVQLRLVEKALNFVSKLSPDEEILSEEEHKLLMKELEPTRGMHSGVRLKIYRLRGELTQQRLAKRSGISQANISAMEKGSRTIGLNVAKKLAKILKCDYKKLV